MLRRRRTLSVYAASAPVGSVFFRSSSTAHCARATAWATVRLQDRVWEYICEGIRSDVRITCGGFANGRVGRPWGGRRSENENENERRGERGEEREREKN